MKIRRTRWSDNDRYLGPFTYARDGRGYRPLAVVLSSRGDDDEESGHCTLRISGFGHTLIAIVPPVVRPWRRWVDLSKRQFYRADGKPEPKRPDAGYWDVHARRYGFSLDGAGDMGGSAFLQVFLGPQTHDSSTTRSWSKFLPWTEWRHVRRSLYDLEGRHFWSEGEYQPSRKASRDERLDGSRRRMDAARDAEAACPSFTFAFADFDGEHLTARTHIEEREWRLGTGCFRWLSLFRKPLIIRRLDITFSGETGRRKGSWKGGTLATNGPIMEPGETHEATFRRYCTENRMTFIGLAATPTTTEVGHG
ncbi:hypothetical protein HCU64_06350 [Methylobacterium sp. C25]|uniref:hypothetical protein n=1 Tax=Methylobacterium sp. C25 TaxID=2721622 RepID=UPI001F1958F6|nr:hypothetical protein [Methylobacterium sp. C25]MCE4223366.1 hypothetical protein [Methylobacterium sp. C25]